MILGIDPGSLFTGFGLVSKGEGGKLAHVCDGEIVLDPDSPLPERLLRISVTLKEIMEEYRPEAVSIESVFHAKNVRSAILLGHARGVALLSAALHGIEVFEYSPRSIKQAVVGYGGAEKAQVQKMVKALLNIPELPKENAADALAAAICHIHNCRGVAIGKELIEKASSGKKAPSSWRLIKGS